NDILNGGGAGSFQNNSGAVLVKDGGTATTRIDLVFFPYNGGTIKVTAQGARIKFTPFMLNFGGLSITVTSAGMDFSAGLEQDSGSTSIVANTATITVAGGNFVLKGEPFPLPEILPRAFSSPANTSKAAEPPR